MALPEIIQIIIKHDVYNDYMTHEHEHSHEDGTTHTHDHEKGEHHGREIENWETSHPYFIQFYFRPVRQLIIRIIMKNIWKCLNKQ